MDLENPLCSSAIRNHVDIRFLPDADLVADGVDSLLLLMSIQG